MHTHTQPTHLGHLPTVRWNQRDLVARQALLLCWWGPRWHSLSGSQTDFFLMELNLHLLCDPQPIPWNGYPREIENIMSRPRSILEVYSSLQEKVFSKNTPL